MAISHPYEVNYTIEDAKRKISILTVYIWRRDKYTEDALFEGIRDPEQFAVELGLAIDKLITGRIKKITIGTTLMTSDFPFPFSSGSFKPVADIGSDVEEGVRVTFLTAQGNYFSHRIPTIDEIYLTERGELDQSEFPIGRVAEYLTLMTLPSETPADWEVYPTDNRNIDLTDWTASGDAFNFSRANQQFRP